MFVAQKPLRRIEIEEIGEDEEATRRRQQMSSAQSKQSALKQRITARDGEQFDKLLSNHSSSHKVATNGAAAGHHVNYSSISSPADIMLNVTSGESSTQNGVDSAVEASVDGDSDTTDVIPRPSATATTNGSHHKPSPATSKLPSVPSTSYQFQADYKMLRSNPELFYQYFKVCLII